MENERRLRECPFCGNEAELWSNQGRNGYFVYCECTLCGSRAKTFFVGPCLPAEWGETIAAKRACEAWNRRMNQKTDGGDDG